MATSGSTNYSKDARALVTTAFRYAGIIGIADTPSSEDADYGLDQLNLMVKTWGADPEPKLWLITEGSQALVQGTASYDLSATGARKVLSVRRRTNSIDTPLIPWSRSEYFDQPTKSQQGTPTAWYFDPQRATRNLYVWLTPDAYSAANTTLQYTYLRVIEDLDDLANDLDVPQEWSEALTTSLAARLIIPYRMHISDPTGAAEVKARAETLYASLSSYDEEEASFFLQPA